jgi:hypothetical protein
VSGRSHIAPRLGIGRPRLVASWLPLLLCAHTPFGWLATVPHAGPDQCCARHHLAFVAPPPLSNPSAALSPWACDVAARLVEGPVTMAMGCPLPRVSPLADAGDLCSGRATPLQARHARPSLSRSLCARASATAIGRSRHALSCLGALLMAMPCARPPPLCRSNSPSSRLHDSTPRTGR